MSVSQVSYRLKQRGPLGEALAHTTSFLFSKRTIRDVEFPNRVFVSPMCMYSANNGYANEFHLVHLCQFVLRGYALVMAESTAVLPEGRISPQDLGLWEDAHIPALARITSFAHALGGKIGIQLSHAGRKGSTCPPYTGVRRGMEESEGGWTVVAPSPIAFSPAHLLPVELQDVEAVVHAFQKAAARAVQAGFDVIEIHAAHGYLLHQFLSPVTNQRTDDYGGTLENRARLLVRVVKAVRDVLKRTKVLLFLRLSCTDWLTHSSWNMLEVERVVQWVRDDIDVVDCSSGMLSPEQKVPESPGYQVPFAKALRSLVPSIAVGQITTPEQAEEILKSESADFVMMAREMLRDNWLYRASKKLNTDMRVAMQYERCKEEPTQN